METMLGKIKAAVVLVGGAACSLLGALAVPLGLLVAGSVTDYITGMLAAPFRGEGRNSRAGLRGIVKKILSWLLVAVGMVVDVLLHYLGAAFGGEGAFRFWVACLVCLWLLCNELLSIVENISDAGVAVPPFLRPVIAWVKDKAEKEGKTVENGADGHE